MIKVHLVQVKMLKGTNCGGSQSFEGRCRTETFFGTF